MALPVTYQARLAAIAVNEAGKTALRVARRSPLSRWASGVPNAYHLLILPQDLRTGDPSFAVELYDGYFGLAGATACIGSESPFSVMPPSASWLKELYAFSWLRHLHAAEDQIAREKARTLFSDWAALGGKAPAVARETDIAARRVIAILSHAAFLLDGADPEFYDLVMRMLSRDLHGLTVIYGDGTGVPRLRALTALLLAGLCVAEQEAYLTAFVSTFSQDIERQILDDGGHISRDPAALIELLLDLLPLKQCFVARQIDPPDALYSALRRIKPMLRFLRLGDGSLAHFNGMGATFLDQVATVLSYDDVGSTFQGVLAPQSGYARLAAAGVVLIADAGGPPPLSLSARAHAGCSSFEMSVGHEPLITNCGAPLDETSDWYVVSRSTAAHSTLTIDDLSSSTLMKAQGHASSADLFWLAGPGAPRREFADMENSLSVTISHDGYQDRFGAIHNRRLTLRKSGSEVEGHDQLVAADGAPAAAGAQFAIRFHLHPRVAATRSRNTNAVTMTTPGGESWRLSTDSVELDIEESIFFADPICLRRSLQIVLKGPLSKQVSVLWKIERIAPAKTKEFDGPFRRVT